MSDKPAVPPGCDSCRIWVKILPTRPHEDCRCSYCGAQEAVVWDSVRRPNGALRGAS